MGETPNRIKLGVTGAGQVGSHSFSNKAPGSMIRVFAEVSNSGGSSGTAVLGVSGPGGANLGTRSLQIAAGAREQMSLSFAVPNLPSGSHLFAVTLGAVPGGNLLHHQFTVVIAAATPAPTVTTPANLVYVTGSLSIT